jgi:hypothetical protein
MGHHNQRLTKAIMLDKPLSQGDKHLADLYKRTKMMSRQEYLATLKFDVSDPGGLTTQKAVRDMQDMAKDEDADAASKKRVKDFLDTSLFGHPTVKPHMLKKRK